MIGYKIHYLDKDSWINYDNVIYNSIDIAMSVIIDAQEQFPDKVFEYYEININE